MLDIKGLHARVGNKEILRGIDLHIGAGEVHAIMGPNASGKSTLAHVLSGRENYQVTAGSVTYQGKDLLAMSPELRAREGVFLAFQYPVEIPGVSTTYFLKAALNAVRKTVGQYVMIPALKQVIAHYADDPAWVMVRPPLTELTAAQAQQVISGLKQLGFHMPGLGRAAAKSTV